MSGKENSPMRVKGFIAGRSIQDPNYMVAKIIDTSHALFGRNIRVINYHDGRELSTYTSVDFVIIKQGRKKVAIDTAALS